MVDKHVFKLIVLFQLLSYSPDVFWWGGWLQAGDSESDRPVQPELKVR